MFLAKIADYLEQEFNADLAKMDEKARVAYLDSEEAKARCAVIDYFRFSDGVCAGVSVLWAYGKHIADDPATDKSKATDDIQFFHRMHKLISDWDMSKPFTQQEKNDLNTFITNIIHYQRGDVDLEGSKEFSKRFFTTFSQEELSLLMEDTKRGNPVEVYRLSVTPATATMLHNHLAKVVTPGKMIFVNLNIQGGGKHKTAIYQNESDKRLFYFDINNDGTRVGYETEVKSVAELTQHILVSANPIGFNAMARMILNPLQFRTCNIGLSIYQFAPEKKRVVLEDSMRISDEEFAHLRVSYPNEFTVPMHAIARQIIDSLTSEQVMRLLKDPSNHEAFKKHLLDNIVRSPTRYSIQLNRYVLQRHLDSIAPHRLPVITERAAGHIDFDSAMFGKMTFEEALVAKKQLAMEWLSEYDKGRIDQVDIQLLTLSEALFIASHRPGDKVFLDRMLSGCNSHHQFEGVNEHVMFGNVMKAAKANIDSGNIELAKEIISFAYEHTGLIPSSSAIARLGNLAVASYVIDLAPHMIESKYAALEIAIENDDVEELKALLALYEININDALNNGERLAHHAIRNLSLNVIEFLKANGADFMLTNKYDNSALSVFDDACKFSLYRYGYDKLSQAGDLLYQYYPVNVIQIPLIRMAIERDDVAEFQKLLSRFKINDMQFDMGFDATFAHVAAKRCSLNILKYLTAQHADFSAQNKVGDSPLSVLINHTMYLKEDDKRLDDRFVAAEMMIAAGALRQQKNPIEDAMRAEWCEMIPFLVTHGVNINNMPAEKPLLWLAALRVSLNEKWSANLPVSKTIDTLIECGANIHDALAYARRYNQSMGGENQKIVDLFEALSKKAAQGQRKHSTDQAQVAMGGSHAFFATSDAKANDHLSTGNSDLEHKIDAHIKHLTEGINHPTLGERRRHKMEVLKIAKKYLNGQCDLNDLIATQAKYHKWKNALGKSDVAKLVNDVMEAKRINHNKMHGPSK